jgi:hypothetical protein
MENYFQCGINLYCDIQEIPHPVNFYEVNTNVVNITLVKGIGSHGHYRKFPSELPSPHLLFFPPGK